MRVYLDNNILVDIEDGTIQIETFTARCDVSYFFSAVHMDELLNGLDKHPELKEIRLNTLENLCSTNYVAPDVGSFEGGFEVETPKTIFELSLLFKRINDELYRYSNSVRVNREAFLKGLHLEKLEVGNYKPSEIFNVLEERLKKSWGHGIQVYLERSEATTVGLFSPLYSTFLTMFATGTIRILRLASTIRLMRTSLSTVTSWFLMIRG